MNTTLPFLVEAQALSDALLSPTLVDEDVCGSSFTTGDVASCTDQPDCSYIPEVLEDCTAPMCTFTAGDEASCTATAGCSYTPAAGEVFEACEDNDSSGDDCSGFVAGDAASCGTCDYTGPQAAVPEACDAPTCVFTPGDQVSCTGTTGCLYTAAVGDACLKTIFDCADDTVACPAGCHDVAAYTPDCEADFAAAQYTFFEQCPKGCLYWSQPVPGGPPVRTHALAAWC